MRPRLTIDMNRINGRGNLPGMNTLERWRDEGRVELCAAFRLLLEGFAYDKAGAKIEKMTRIGEPFVLGESFLNSEAYLSDGHGPEFREIVAVLFPGKRSLTENDRNDVMHLMAHIGSRADIFVTNDGAFVRARELLRLRWSIDVKTDDEAVAHLHDLFGWPL